MGISQFPGEALLKVLALSTSLGVTLLRGLHRELGSRLGWEVPMTDSSFAPSSLEVVSYRRGNQAGLSH